MRHLLTLNNYTGKEILKLVKLAKKVKRKRHNYENKLKGKTLVMIFAKPSLRTHLSFDIAMHQLGGHAIFYDLSHSTLGKKESVKDFSKVVSRYADIVMARLYGHAQIEELAKYSGVPVINGLTDAYHPCQILGDLLTIREKLGKLKGKKIVYVGDANNNVTHSLIIACRKLGMEIVVSCPSKPKYMPNKKLVGKDGYKIIKDPVKAVKNSDVVYTDTWMSYQVKKFEEKSRIRALKNYQVNEKLMRGAGKKAIFMHCLPAGRGVEVTDKVMDSKASVVYDQAENRTYAEKAILLRLLNSVKK
jgi:ornithine carbamoyltransferase